MNTITPIIYSNKYNYKNFYQTKAKANSHSHIEDAVFKTNSKIAYSYGISQVSMKGNHEKEVDINSYYDLHKWAFYGELYEDKQKKVEPLKIKSEEIYINLLNSLENQGVHPYKHRDFRQKKYYPNLPDKYIGLIPYCGVNDYSSDINKYLSGRKIDFITRYNPQALNKMCSILDYSLNELDKEYGKYNGTVYRIGFFEGDVPQYFSTSMEPKEKQYINLLKIKQEMNKENNKPLSPDLVINIINVKDGHKIYDFQKEYLKPNEDDRIISNEDGDNIDIVNDILNEQEILLPKSSTYKEIQDDEKMNKAKENLAKSLLPLCIKENIEGWCSVEDISKHIKLWEEVEN